MSLTIFKKSQAGPTAVEGDIALHLASEGLLWVDLLKPTTEEEQLIEGVFNIDAPSEKERGALEESARFYIENDVLVLNATVAGRGVPSTDRTQPTNMMSQRREIVSFFLTHKTLITVRNCPLRAFEANAGRASANLTGAENAAEVLLALLESLVERAADLLSISGKELEEMNLRVLVGRRHVRLEAILKRLGQLGVSVSQTRDSLSSLLRLTRFLVGHGPRWDVPQARLHHLATDIETLQRQAESLTNDLTFFLDATLGLVGARQNETLKAMAIVTLLFVPPTLIASVFGMNFEHMSIFADPNGVWWALGGMFASSALIVSIARLGKWL